MDFKNVIAELIHKETGLSKDKILEIIEVPPDHKMGDYAFPCFILSKELKKSPQTIALELKDKINLINIKEEHKHFEHIKNDGPYINFFINKQTYTKKVLQDTASGKLLDFKNKDKRIMIEFGQPNTHKEFHVGHLRTHFLGSSLAKIYAKLNYDVVSANYPGDMGTHIAKALWCYMKFHKKDTLPENKGLYLGKIYVEAAKLLEDENESYKKEVSEVLQKLEARDSEIIQLWKETRKWSLDQFQHIYDELNIKYDVWFYESEVETEGKKIAYEILEKGIAKKDQGAVLVDLNEYGLDVFLLIKRDGTSLYAAKDLALAKRKFKEFHIDKSIYVVDVRQSMYFKQLFKTLELMGFKEDMVHVPYEIVATKNGPIASRTGNAISYEDLNVQVTTFLERETQKRHMDWSFRKIQENSKKLMIAALKFGMLKYDNTSTILFDMDEWVKTEGETGTYIEYTHARINSIFKKFNNQSTIDIKALNPDTNLLTEDKEYGLCKLIAKFPEVIEESAKYYKPSTVARYLLDVCQKFNEYYHSTPVLVDDEALRNARLYLIYNIQKVIKEGLNLLGIDEVDEM
jgi:arginyl-tRNA synthetase